MYIIHTTVLCNKKDRSNARTLSNFEATAKPGTSLSQQTTHTGCLYHTVDLASPDIELARGEPNLVCKQPRRRRLENVII